MVPGFGIYMKTEALQRHSAGMQVCRSAGGFKCQAPTMQKLISAAEAQVLDRYREDDDGVLLGKYNSQKGTRHAITPCAVFCWTRTIAKESTGKCCMPLAVFLQQFCCDLSPQGQQHLLQPREPLT